MKKLILSAFAMSLFLLGQVSAQEDEELLLPELSGTQKFSPLEMHQKSEWNVSEKQVEIDTLPLKGQSYSLIPWKTLDAEDFLSIDTWLLERSLKDKQADWKIRLRDDRQAELVGKILQCHGKCEVYRGSMAAKAQHLSQIKEGDELKTHENSVAWVYLMDGTLVRVGPKSSVAFQEINWSQSEVFHLLRLSQGQVFWHPRSPESFPQEMTAETDAISLPVLIREANQGFFERAIFQSQNDRLHLAETVELETSAINAQILKINETRLTNNKLGMPPARVMIVAPNGTLVSKQVSFDFMHLCGGKSYFKKRSGPEGHELNLTLRGYVKADVNPITDEKWYEIEAKGKNFEAMEQPSGDLQITELITKRIRTIELAREIWIEKYTAQIVADLKNPKELAIHHGYSLWGEELSRRLDFLSEYTRRIETTNLRSLENLLKKLEDSGVKIDRELHNDFYQASLNEYLKSIKTRYTSMRTQVREMNDLQYYVWILREGKN